MELQGRTPGNGPSRTPPDDGASSPRPATVVPSPILDSEISSSTRGIRTWWSQNISLTVFHTSHAPTGGDHRDYLALERTYLGWVRTSIAIASMGVVVTQLFVLRQVDATKGIALGVLFSCGGIVAILVGCVRYFKLQRQLTLGKALAGGWHAAAIWVFLMSVLVVLLVIVLVDT